LKLLNIIREDLSPSSHQKDQIYRLLGKK